MITLRTWKFEIKALRVFYSAYSFLFIEVTSQRWIFLEKKKRIKDASRKKCDDIPAKHYFYMTNQLRAFGFHQTLCSSFNVPLFKWPVSFSYVYTIEISNRPRCPQLPNHYFFSFQISHPSTPSPPPPLLFFNKEEVRFYFPVKLFVDLDLIRKINRGSS